MFVFAFLCYNDKNRYLKDGEIMKYDVVNAWLSSQHLINNPYQLTSLNTFSEKYEAANLRFRRYRHHQKSF